MCGARATCACFLEHAYVGVFEKHVDPKCGPDLLNILAILRGWGGGWGGGGAQGLQLGAPHVSGSAFTGAGPWRLWAEPTEGLLLGLSFVWGGASGPRGGGDKMSAGPFGREETNCHPEGGGGGGRGGW